MSDATSPAAEAPGLPWENRAELGFFPALFDTVKGVLLEPSQTFATIRGDGIGGALLFAVILGTFGGIVGLVWQLAFTAVMPLIERSLGQEMEQALLQTAIFAVLMPALVVLQQFIIAGVVHLCALVFGAGKRGFEATFRVIAYSLGSTAILNLVPGIGGIAAVVWSLVAAIIGIATVQETTGGRAAGAVLTPVALCCVGSGGLIAIALALVFGMSI